MSSDCYNVKSVRDQLLSKGGKIAGAPDSKPDGVELQGDWTVKCLPDTRKASADCVTWLNIKGNGLPTATIAIYYSCFSKPGCNDLNGGYVLITSEKRVLLSWGIRPEKAKVSKGDVGYLRPSLPKVFQ